MTAAIMLRTVALASIGDWLTTFSLIFGGCCSNALALELITTQYPPAGTLITFAQFLLVTVASLRNQLVFKPAPVTPYKATQVIIDRLDSLQKSKGGIRTLNVVIRGPVARAKELSNYLVKSGSQFKLVKFDPDCGQRVQVEADTSKGSAHRIDLQYTVIPEHCAVNYHDFVISLYEGRVDKDKPDRSRSSLCLDVADPKRPVFTYPLPSRRFLQPYRYRLKPRNIPLARYAIQVTLFLIINLLNNAAFAYNVPMTVHIIFRSGGLVVNMLLGWLLYGRRYSRTQIFSILLVTFGVALTTLSSTHSKRARTPIHSPPEAQTANMSSGSFTASYATGIAILTFALVLSGILGHQQDASFAQYGRSHWSEALFYLHALALPLFGFAAPRMAREMRAVSSGDAKWIGIDLPFSPSSAPSVLSSAAPFVNFLMPTPILDYKRPVPLRLALSIPAFYLPLLLNALTQLLCVAGVNRLTARVSSLTVTLVLVVRKAVSLAISMTLFQKGGGEGWRGTMLWVGAAAVLAGTVGYTIGSKSGEKAKVNGEGDDGKSKKE